MCQRPYISNQLPRGTDAAASRGGSRAAVGNLSVKGQIDNLLGFVGHTVSVAYSVFVFYNL